MKYWNSTLKNMDEYIPGEQPANINEIIKLNTNENPFPPSPAALEAISRAASADLRRYPSSSAAELRQAFAEVNGISPENVFAGNGSDEIFTLIFRGFIEKTGTAAFPYPSYALYDTLAQGSGIRYEKIQLGDDFSYDLNRFLEKPYDLVIIANPNNPTGTYCQVKDIEKFLEKYRGLMVVDEAYIDFYGGSAIKLIRDFDNLIVTRTMSKSYSLAGLRVGFAAADREIIRGLVKIKDSYNVDSPAQAGAAAALKDEKTFRYNISQVKNCKEYLEEKLEAMDFTIIPSRANFLFVKHAVLSAQYLFDELKKENIFVRHYTGERESDYIRISIGTMGEIKKLCTVLGNIIAEAGAERTAETEKEETV